MPTMSLGEDLGEQPAAKTASAIKSVKRVRALRIAELDSAEIINATQAPERRQSGVRRSVTISYRRSEPRASRQRRGGFFFPNPTPPPAEIPWDFRAGSPVQDRKALAKGQGKYGGGNFLEGVGGFKRWPLG